MMNDDGHITGMTGSKYEYNVRTYIIKIDFFCKIVYKRYLTFEKNKILIIYSNYVRTFLSHTCKCTAQLTIRL